MEKIFSYDAAEHANVQKGLYHIKDNYLCFWYRYVFPHLSAILLEEDIYETALLPTFPDYMRECFSGVCTEYLKLMGQYHRLIDIVAGDEEGNILVGFCRFDNHMVSQKDYDSYLELLDFAALKPQECYLFSKAGFTGELQSFAEGKNLHLVGLEDL